MEINFEELAKIKGTLCILGETGTGKSTLAKSLHCQNNDRTGAYVPFAVGACNDELLARELYGNLKGAYTGADHCALGVCDQAQGGTLFLDEIGEMSLESQKKLLMLLEERIYYPVGSSRPKHFSGRIIVATHRNLLELVNEGIFREDLYFRVAQFCYHIKPLRDDRPRLQQLLTEFLQNFGYTYEQLTEEELKWIYAYDWPGNIRELKSNVEFYHLLGRFPLLHNTLNHQLKGTVQFPIMSYKKAMENYELELMNQMLKRNSFQINKTARMFGISKTTLLAKIKKYQLRRHEI